MTIIVCTAICIFFIYLYNIIDIKWIETIIMFFALMSGLIAIGILYEWVRDLIFGKKPQIMGINIHDDRLELELELGNRQVVMWDEVKWILFYTDTEELTFRWKLKDSLGAPYRKTASIFVNKWSKDNNKAINEVLNGIEVLNKKYKEAESPSVD